MAPLSDELIAQLDDKVTYEDGGRNVPVRQHPFVRDTADFPSFVRDALAAHREIGRRLPVNVKDDNERAEWRKNHMPKLYEAGLVSKPPASVDEYNDVVKRPETIPDGWGWNEDFAKEFKTILHKHGVPKAAVADLLALHEKTMIGASKVLKSSMEEGEAALRAEFGDKYETLAAAVPRLTAMIFKTPEELALFEDAGWGNHPGFLGVLLRLAALAQSDSSFFVDQNRTSSVGGANMTPEEVRAEMARIYSDPKHPHHEGFLRNDPRTLKYVEDLYKRAGFDPNKKVELG